MGSSWTTAASSRRSSSAQVLDEETERIRKEVGEKTWHAGRPGETREVFERVALSPELIQFLTIPAYDYLR